MDGRNTFLLRMIGWFMVAVVKDLHDPYWLPITEKFKTKFATKAIEFAIFIGNKHPLGEQSSC